MSRLNEYKKATFEDKFWRRWVCCKKNHNEVWAWMKKRTRKNYRLYLKKNLTKEINESII